LFQPTPLAQVAVIAAGALAGFALTSGAGDDRHISLGAHISKTTAGLCLIIFFALLIALPLIAASSGSHVLAMIDAFYRAGSLVFGGGHVVLPLLQAEVVPTGWMSNDTFLAGYGAAQAVPGPLFTFAAFLGTVSGPEPNGWVGALICLFAIFTSSFLLVVGAIPFWDDLRRTRAAQQALLGVNAAVVGLLLAALYDPIWTNSIRAPGDFVLALAGFVLLVFWKIAPWLVVLLTAAGGWALAAVA
jgi:chromate transporter